MSHVEFEGDFWGETGLEFSHSLGRFPPLKLARFSGFERLLLMKAAGQLCDFEKSLPKGCFAPNAVEKVENSGE